MTGYANPLHTDVNDIKTSARYGTVGDGTSQWFETAKILEGDNVTQGSKTDVAVTAVDATAGSVVALLKGIISTLTTYLGVGATRLLKLEDAAHASGDAGIMALAIRNDARANLSGTDLDYTGISAGTAGNLMVSQAPSSLSAWSPSRASVVAAAASLIVKASAGKLYRLHIVNGGTAQFFQIHNTTTVPADTAVPIMVFRLDANESRTIDLGSFGEYFSTGITVCNSSTMATKTIGAADSWINAQYL